MRIHGVREWILVTAAALAACGTDAAGPEGAAFRSLPGRFKILGDARGSDAEGRTASCSIDFQVERTEVRHRGADLVEYVVTYGGGASRGVVEPDGSGTGLFADLYGPGAVVRLIGADSLVLLLGDTLHTASRFWRSIALLAGSTRGGTLGTGDWQCGPFDINSGGYVDTVLTVPGTWWIER